MARVRIRLAKSGDYRALAEMRYRLRAETESAAETKSQFVRRCTSWMKKHFQAGSCPWRCWVVDDGERLLGHVCVQLFEKIPNPIRGERELHAYVTNFYVLPEMRRQGCGKRLDRVKLLIALHGRTERAAPHDIRGEVPVRKVGVVLVPAGLEFLDQAHNCLKRFLRLSSFRAQRRTVRLMFVIHGDLRFRATTEVSEVPW